jgi:hypothetical protein
VDLNRKFSQVEKIVSYNQIGKIFKTGEKAIPFIFNVHIYCVKRYNNYCGLNSPCFFISKPHTQSTYRRHLFIGRGKGISVEKQRWNVTDLNGADAAGSPGC